MRRKSLIFYLACSLQLVSAQAQTSGQVFAKSANEANDVRTLAMGEYWIDGMYNDRKAMNVNGSGASFSCDVTELTEGLHTISFIVKDSKNNYSATKSLVFYHSDLKNAHKSGSPEQCEYWLDDDYAHRRTVSIHDSLAAFSCQVDELTEGLHTLSYIVKDSQGMCSSTKSLMFYHANRMGNTVSHTPDLFEYWIDNDPTSKKSIKINSDSAVFSIDISSCNDGSHTLTYQIKDTAGQCSSTRVWEFVVDTHVPTTTLSLENQSNREVTLKWSADEDEIKFYNVYVAENEESFYLWKPNTTTTSATFMTKEGTTYRILVTAKDVAGNKEKYDEENSITITP